MKKQIKQGVEKSLARIKLIAPILIISTLAACSISVSEDEIIRTRLSESLILAETYQDLVVNNATKGLLFNYGAPVFVATDNAESITTSSAIGVITITGSAKVKGIILFLTPTQEGGAALVAGTPPTGRIEWICTTTATNLAQVPVECR